MLISTAIYVYSRYISVLYHVETIETTISMYTGPYSLLTSKQDIIYMPIVLLNLPYLIYLLLSECQE